MGTNKWIVSILSALLITLMSFATVMYTLDPLLQYGAESEPLTYYRYSEGYSNPGIAEHYNYDTVLVGTSMVENTNIDEFDELMQCKAVRLPYSGGTALNMKKILEICFSSKNQIKTVYWGLDEHQLFSNPDETRYTLPEYLYRRDVKEDVRYLLNLDIFAHYALHDIVKTIKGYIQPAARRGETFTGIYDKETVLNEYVRPKSSKMQIEKTDAMDKTVLNLSKNIKPLVETHPDTNFVFFFVPYSILYWDAEVQSGTFEATMNALEYAISDLLTYKNVKIYFFHNEKQIITDLNNYKDYSHYGNWINSYMTKEMSVDRNRLTIHNYQQQIEDLRQFINTYDFDALFE